MYRSYSFGNDLIPQDVCSILKQLIRFWADVLHWESGPILKKKEHTLGATVSWSCNPKDKLENEAARKKITPCFS